MLLRCAASGEAEPPSSSGPGRRPFKAVTGIRTPLGAPSAPHATHVAPAHRVLWCSLECTPPCQGGGRGFKSRQDRGRPSLRRRSSRGRVAQSAEHAPEKRGVTGSTPVPATSESPGHSVALGQGFVVRTPACHTRATPCHFFSPCRPLSASSGACRIVRRRPGSRPRDDQARVGHTAGRLRRVAEAAVCDRRVADTQSGSTPAADRQLWRAALRACVTL